MDELDRLHLLFEKSNIKQLVITQFRYTTGERVLLINDDTTTFSVWEKDTYIVRGLENYREIEKEFTTINKVRYFLISKLVNIEDVQEYTDTEELLNS